MASNVIGYCDNCGAQFFRSRADHRFCSIPCHHEFHIAERKAALEFFRAQQTKVQREVEPEEQQRRVG
jgi:hypothetical protein